MQIKDTLIKEYYSSNIPENTPCPSMRELIKKFNTSMATIDKVFKELKKDNIIYSVPGLGSFWGKKRYLIRYKTIGICFAVEGIVSKINSPYFFSMLEGIEEVFSKYGLNIKLLRFENIETIDSIRETHCDAFICAGSHKNILPIVDNFKKLHIPYLLLDRPDNSESLNYLERDSAENIQSMVDYLAANGHREICCIGRANDLWIDKKLYLGFEAGMEKHHLSVRNTMLQLPFGPSFDLTYETLEKIKLAETLRKHTALIILTPRKPSIDIILKYCENNNIRIPDDCSLISLAYADQMVIRDKSLICHVITPFEMGFKAADGITGLLNNTITPPLHIRFPLRIVEGNTVRNLSESAKRQKIKTHILNSVFELEKL